MDSLLLIVIAVIFFIPLLIQGRRQRRRMFEIQQLQQSLTPGDRVVTTSGVHGIVRQIDEDLVDLEIAVGVVTTWDRAAIIRRVDAETALADGTPEVAETGVDTPADDQRT